MAKKSFKHELQTRNNIAADNWQNGEHSSAAKLRVTHLERDKYYQFRVQALGRKGLTSDWSNVEEVLVS